MFRTIGNARRFCSRPARKRAGHSAGSRNAFHRTLLCEPLEDRRLLDVGMATGSMFFESLGAGDADALVSYATATGFTPQEIRTAYGIDEISAGSLVADGAGQTIAIIGVYNNPKFVNSTSTGFLSSDLHQFDVALGIADPPSFLKLDQYGGTNYPAVAPSGTNWASETAMDVEWAHAIAPKANIVLIEAKSASFDDVLTALETARSLPDVSVISMSIGWFEQDPNATAEQGKVTGENEATMDALLTTPAGHQGVTFIAASGDDGTPGMYPALSPNVVAVGGTALSTTTSDVYSSEKAWSGSGGGASYYALEPDYQDDVQDTGFRTIPDVAFDADPFTGVAVYDSYTNGTAKPWNMFGGTSLGAPCWAGLIAITNQIRASKGLGSLDGVTQTLPRLYELASASFHDIVVGAGVGYDQVTGLGTPVADRLVPALAMLTETAAPTIAATSLTGGVLGASATQFSVTFSDAMLDGDAAANYELHRAGADGLLGTADDVAIALSPSYSGVTATLSFAALPEDVYRLVVHDTLTAAWGNALDGDGNGTAGGDWSCDFVVTAGSATTLTSPHSKTFDIATSGLGSGQLLQGTANAFDGYSRLMVGGVLFQAGTSSSTADNGRSVVTGEGTLSGLTISRKITVPSTGSEDFARTIDSFTNSTGAPITTTATIVGNLGSDAATIVFATSDGDTTVETTDQWIGTDGNGTPAIVHYLHGPTGLTPTAVEVIGDNIRWTYDVTVQPGQTLDLAYFAIVASTREAATAAAEALITTTGFGGQAAAFLTDAEKTALANFAPTATVSLNSHGPKTNDVLTATVSGWGLQGGPQTFTYVWQVNGVEKETHASVAALTDTFDLGATGNGATDDVVTVLVTPNDGQQDGATVNDSATVVNTAPIATVNAPASPQTGAVTLGYVLADADSDACGVQVQVSLDGGTTWATATQGSGGDGLSNLTAAPIGTAHTFVWNSAADLNGLDRSSVKFRVTPSDSSGAGAVVTTNAFAVNAPAATFSVKGPTSGTYTAGQNVTIEWTAAGVAAGATISLCYDEDTTWGNGNEHWITTNQAAFNGNGSYAWNTTGTTADAYYLAGTLSSNGKSTASHLTQPVTIQAPPNAGPTIEGVTLGLNRTIPVITWNVADASGIRTSSMTIDGNPAAAIYGPYGSATNASYAGAIGSLAKGTHTYAITAIDALGAEATPATGTFTIGATDSAPTIRGVTLGLDRPVPVITWNVTDAAGIRSSSFVLDGKQVSLIYGPYGSATDATYAGAVGVLTNGTHIYTITATNAGGVSTTISDSFTIGNPATPPTIGGVTLGLDRTTPVITWYVTDTVGIRNSSLTIDGVPASAVYGPYGSTTNASYAGAIGSLAKGTHIYAITATNASGLAATPVTGSFTIGEPASPPTIGGVTLGLERATPVITWNVTDAVGVRTSSLTIDGTPAVAVYGPYGSATNASYSGVIGTLAKGKHTYAITATNVGNVAATPVTGTFEVTTDPPVTTPTITDVRIFEASGTQNGVLTTAEPLEITWRIINPSGVVGVTLQMDGMNVTPVYGPYVTENGVCYSALLGTRSAGVHTYSIVANNNTGKSVATYSGMFVVVAALTVDASALPESSATQLDEAQLASIVTEAQRRLTATGDSRVLAALTGVEIEVADLPDGLLGEAEGKTIRIDRDAAGYGWFIDATPADDVEFVARPTSETLVADADGPAAARVDLLTTVMHEMGHVLGCDHVDDGLMAAALPLGVRRAAVDEVFALI